MSTLGEIWALCLALGGCLPSTYGELPGQVRAEDYVWRQFYQMNLSDLPEVEWIKADSWGEHATGMTWVGWKIQVACGNRCDWPIADTALAHELLHWRSWIRTGDVDAFHEREDWVQADDAQYCLIEMGLGSGGQVVDTLPRMCLR